MASRPSPRLLELFEPPREEDFLVEGERVVYRDRYHSAILLYPALDLAALLTIFVMGQPRVIGNPIGAFCFLIAAIYLVLTVIKLRARIEKMLKATAALCVATLLTGGGYVTFVLFCTGYLAFRFVNKAVHWLLYRKLYVTDRRLIATEGFLGNEIATMPLFKITDVMLTQTAMGLMLGFGRFRVESAGQDQALGNLHYLKDAARFQRLVVALATTPKAGKHLDASVLAEVAPELAAEIEAQMMAT